MTDHDEVPYSAKPYAQSHPDRLATIARLFGLHPPAVENCRVLEIGCGEGLNLIAARITLPRAYFHGIDLSVSSIASGAEMVQSLGLNNVTLEQTDLHAFSGPPQPFDYVVAHGFYSWVPAETRDALLATIGRVLSPNGIAFVSYNAYPGAYLRQMVREMAGTFAARDIVRAREFLSVLRDNPSGPSVFQSVVSDEANDMLARDDGALFHDDFAAINHPVYFREFVSHATAHGLTFVAEADLAGTGPFGLPAKSLASLHSIAGPSRIEREQIYDFARGRRFRQTLLCCAGQPVLESPDPNALPGLYAGGPITRGDQTADGKVEYSSLLGGRLRTADAAAQSTLDALANAWPAYISAGSEHSYLIDLFANKVIDLRTVPPPVAANVQARPLASPLARLQAARGNSVTSLHHFEVLLDNEPMRALLQLADGTKPRAMLIRELGALYSSAPKDKVALAVDQLLGELLRHGLLMQPSH